MATISEATVNDFKTIREIAYQTWPDTYGAILSEKQLDYMLSAFYSEETLKDNLDNKGHHFLLVKEEEICLGFASYEHYYQQKSTTRVHKIYILPQTQGKGIGKLLMDAMENLARENQSDILSLNVNRFNKACTFYQKMGFEIVAEVNLEIGNGYLMEDYVMEKNI